MLQSLPAQPSKNCSPTQLWMWLFIHDFFFFCCSHKLHFCRSNMMVITDDNPALLNHHVASLPHGSSHTVSWFVLWSLNVWEVSITSWGSQPIVPHVIVSVTYACDTHCLLVSWWCFRLKIILLSRFSLVWECPYPSASSPPIVSSLPNMQLRQRTELQVCRAQWVRRAHVRSSQTDCVVRSSLLNTLLCTGCSLPLH